MSIEEKIETIKKLINAAKMLYYEGFDEGIEAAAEGEKLLKSLTYTKKIIDELDF
jgi:hypothetical protein